MMIAFNHHTRQFPKKKLCRYGERREMKEAVEFIDGLTAGGGTNMRPAWQLALQEIKRHGITTVYFLTDGEDGEGLQAPELLGMIHAEAPRGLVVHCFAIGRDQKFMEEVAKARKGRYVYRP